MTKIEYDAENGDLTATILLRGDDVHNLRAINLDITYMLAKNNYVIKRIKERYEHVDSYATVIQSGEPWFCAISDHREAHVMCSRYLTNSYIGLWN